MVDHRPIFVAGCGRSGTTFLGEQLGRLADTVVTPESQFKLRLFTTGELDATSRRLGAWGLDSQVLSRASAMGQVQGMQFLVDSYAKRVGIRPAQRWVDHTPSNWMIAPLLASIYPGAQFVHIVRDVRGVASSVSRTSWAPMTLRRLERWWCGAVIGGLGMESLLQDRTIRIRYEDLVCRPEEAVARLADFLGLRRPTSRMTPGFVVPDVTRHQHALVGGPPLPERAFAWRHELAGPIARVLATRCNELLEQLGFEVHPDTDIGLRTTTTAEIVWAGRLLQSRARHLRRRVAFNA